MMGSNTWCAHEAAKKLRDLWTSPHLQHTRSSLHCNTGIFSCFTPPLVPTGWQPAWQDIKVGPSWRLFSPHCCRMQSLSWYNEPKSNINRINTFWTFRRRSTPRLKQNQVTVIGRGKCTSAFFLRMNWHPVGITQMLLEASENFTSFGFCLHTRS